MYLQSFGLREKPFALLPDPRYLFLAESHREALAHLLYGVDQGEGFIAVVGEVGTGKTTLCRTLLARLGAGTEVAFLFNPDLSPLELLESICTEFGVAVPGDASRRDLLERINEFLVHNKRQNRRVLLIIDEAQNLPTETLEQVRLLSNLETETSKLVQIILLGQPELEVKLASQELRQLRQRISVWWTLGPLSRPETAEYVRHRLRVAGGATRSCFNDRALREVHRRAQGVPRVVNILCDRALLAAFAEGARDVELRHVRKAAAELGSGRAQGPATRGRRLLLHPGWFAAAGIVAILLGTWQLLAGAGWLPGTAPPLPAVSLPPPPEPAAEEPDELLPLERVEPETGTPEEPSDAPQDLDALLERIDARESDVLAAAAVLESWTLDPIASLASLDDLERGLRERGLRVQRMEGSDLTTLRVLNHPAVLRLVGPNGEGRAVVLRGLDGETATLTGLGGEVARVPIPELAARFTGEAWVPWRDFVRTPPILRDGHAGSSVLWLQRTLAALGFYSPAPSGRYDGPTRSAVRAFQTSRGLKPDGEVGPRTKMVLYDAAGEYAFPRLREAG